MEVKAQPSLFDISLVRGHTFVSSVLNSESTVVDAGAHRCEFANTVAAKLGCRVIAIEPNPGLVSERFPKVTLLSAALSGTDGTASLIFDENPEGSSILAGHSAHPSNAPPIEVNVRSIHSILREFRLEHIDLLKLDIEGSEFDVIRCIDDELASRIGQITMEFHPAAATGDSERQIFGAIDALRELGFHAHKASFFGYGDMLFLNSRTFSRPSRLFSVALPYYRKGLECGGVRVMRAGGGH